MTLPKVASDSSSVVGVFGPVEGERRLDDRREPPVGEQRHDVAHERIGRGGLLGDVAAAQHRADEREALAEDRP